MIGLTDDQVCLRERFSPEFLERHIETRHSGDLVAVDTFFIGHLKGVGKIYLQTVIDCLSRYAWGRLYTSKVPVPTVEGIEHRTIKVFINGLPKKPKPTKMEKPGNRKAA